MRRTTDEMIFILSEYASKHPDTVRSFDDLTPYIARHPEIFGGQDEEETPSYQAFTEGESTVDQEIAKACFKKALDLEPLNFDAKSELLALTAKDADDYAAKCLEEQTKGLSFFMKSPEYKDLVGHFFDQTITASFLRFTKTIMQQFFMSGDYDLAVSLGKEMLTLDVKDNYKARHLLFKSLIGLGDDAQTEEFIKRYRFEKDAYYYGSLALYYVKQGKYQEAYDIITGELKEKNMFIADCLLYANDFELRTEAEKPVDTFMDQVAYVGGTREALNYVDEALPFDGVILQDFQDKYLMELLEKKNLDYEATVLLVTMAELSMLKKMPLVSVSLLKTILEGENEPYQDLSMYGELKNSNLIVDEMANLIKEGLANKEGEDYLLTHDAYSVFMALCRMTAREETSKA